MDPLQNSLFTTSGALVNSVDKKMVLVLRDNTKLFGILRSFDQYGNLVLQDSYERIYIEDCFADIPKGVYLVRGENVVLMGEIDIDEEDNVKQQRISKEEAESRIKADMDRRQSANKAKRKSLHSLGFATDPEESREDLYMLY